MIDLQGQRHRKVPLDSDRSGSLQSSVYNRLTENEVAASHAVSRAGWSEKDHRRGFQLQPQAGVGREASLSTTSARAVTPTGDTDKVRGRGTALHRLVVVRVLVGGVCGRRDCLSGLRALRLRKIDSADPATPRFTNYPRVKARCSQKCLNC